MTNTMKTNENTDVDNLINECKEKTNGINKVTVNNNNNIVKIETKNGHVKNGLPKNADTKGKLPQEIGTDYTFKRKIVWFNAIGFLVLHLLAVYGVYLIFASANILTTLWSVLVAFSAGQGVTMGAHRMWSHRGFKAKFAVRLVLILLQTVAGQNCLYIWARDHRLHHKYSDTDADPHNSNRGFFFSHIGWLMSRKHPAVISKGKTIDMSDLERDPLVMLQKTYYNPLYLIFAMAIPVAVPIYMWNESYINSFFVAYMFRYILTLNITWLVNSAAHMFGTKPFDKNMLPVESRLVAFLSVGEGWHNYHHAFPWDYRASELGSRYNFTAMIIDGLAYFGLVYDLHAAPDHMIKYRVLKAGDGSHPKYGHLQRGDNIPQEISYQDLIQEEKELKEAKEIVQLDDQSTTVVHRNVEKKAANEGVVEN